MRSRIGNKQVAAISGSITVYAKLCSNSAQVDIECTDLAIKEKYSNQFKQENYTLDLNDSDVVRYLAIGIIFLAKLYKIFQTKIGHGNMRSRIVAEAERRQNIWKNVVFVNNRSNAVSAI